MSGSGRPQIPGLGVDQLPALIREQVQQAIGEAIGRFPQFGRATKLKATAAIIGLYGGGALVATVIMLLALAMPGWVAGLIVGAVLVVAAVVVRTMARSHTHPEASPTPAKLVAGHPDSPANP